MVTNMVTIKILNDFTKNYKQHKVLERRQLNAIIPSSSAA